MSVTLDDVTAAYNVVAVAKRAKDTAAVNFTTVSQASAAAKVLADQNVATAQRDLQSAEQALQAAADAWDALSKELKQ